MKEVVLDGAGWSTKDDVYDAFFHPVGAPEWHGRNFNALRDGIAGGSINQAEVPYRLVFKNYDNISGEAKGMAEDFIDSIHELAAEGWLRCIRPLPVVQAIADESNRAVLMRRKQSLNNLSFRC